MNTILNLGLNDKATAGLAKATKNERFAYDAYRRLINMFGDVVMGMDHHVFEAAFSKVKKKYKVTDDTEVPAEGLKQLCEDYKCLQEAHWPSIPSKPDQAVGAFNHGRLRLVEYISSCALS